MNGDKANPDFLAKCLESVCEPYGTSARVGFKCTDACALPFDMPRQVAAKRATVFKRGKDLIA